MMHSPIYAAKRTVDLDVYKGWYGRQLLLPEDDSCGDTIAPRHCGEACARSLGLVDDLALVLITECASAPITGRRDNRPQHRSIRHMTRAMT
jgi:hypothetical protein